MNPQHLILIDATAVGLTPTSIILSRLLSVDITLELTTMKGDPHLIKFTGSFCGFDITLDPKARPATLAGLVKLILNRRSPSERYIAEQNGVKVITYKERPSFRQSLNQIVYGPGGHPIP